MSPRSQSCSAVNESIATTEVSACDLAGIESCAGRLTVDAMVRERLAERSAAGPGGADRGGSGGRRYAGARRGGANIGQTVTFACAGTDANGRLLQWELLVQSRGNSMIPEDSRKGDEVTLAWEVVDNHVRENADIQIRLWSEGKYHRHGEWDDYFLVHYHVLSPLVVKALTCLTS
jgi:hypothetical protein